MFETTLLGKCPPLARRDGEELPRLQHDRGAQHGALARVALDGLLDLEQMALRRSFSSGGTSRAASMEYSPFFSTSSRRPALENTRKGCFTFVIRTRLFQRLPACGP